MVAPNSDPGLGKRGQRDQKFKLIFSYTREFKTLPQKIIIA